MDRQVLLRKIMGIGDDVRRLQQDLVALQSIDIVKYPENYSSLSHQAAINCEFITRKMRELVCSTTNISKMEYLEAAADVMGINVTYDGSGVDITIPCLIPHRRKKQMSIITDPLSAALARFVASHPQDTPFLRFTHCVICITHIYDKTLYGKGRKRDHDNIEVKGVIDVINTFLLTDDNENLCDVYTSSELSDHDTTRISVIKKDMFSEWIQRHENQPEKLSLFT